MCEMCRVALHPEPEVGVMEPQTGQTPTAPTPPLMPHAHAVLAEAEAVINGPRRGSYGDVHTSFGNVAQVWSAVLHTQVTPQQVALCMVGLKLCREANAHSHDNLTDLCGYTALLAELAEGGAAK